MARIAGVDLPNKAVKIALTYMAELPQRRSVPRQILIRT